MIVMNVKIELRDKPKGGTYYGSENVPTPDNSALVAQLRRIVDKRFAKFILRKVSNSAQFVHLLGVFAGSERPSGVIERFKAGIINSAMKRAMKPFNISDLGMIKEPLRDKFMRKAIANTLQSVAKYGITTPQKFQGPLMVVWNITKQCNLKCKHCYASAGRRREEELTLEQKLRVVDILDAAGCAMIAFSGGEPTTSRDFWKVAEYASKKGMYVTIATNGTLLTKENVRRLKEIGVKYVEISLDSYDPKIHDEFRGVQGAWARTIQGIKNVVEDGSFDNAIAVTATRFNMDTIPKMIDLAEELKVKKFIVFNFVPTGRGKDIISSDLSPQEREDLLNMIYDRWQKKVNTDIFSTSPTYSRIGIEHIEKGSGETYSPTHFANAGTNSMGVELADFIGGCGAGREYAAIDDNGDVFPCVFLPIKVGNILQDNFQELWENSKLLNDLRDRTNLGGACGTCRFRNSCGGCRARAYGYYGDINAPDPGCIYNEAEYEVLVNLPLQGS